MPLPRNHPEDQAILTEIEGDVFRSTAPLLAHGVNCQGAFGSGMAGQIARRYPEVRDAYLRKHNHYGWELGDIQVVEARTGLLVANLATQDFFGSMRGRTEPWASVDAIEMAVTRLVAHCEARGIDRVATVRLGCGLGGLDWAEVAPAIARQSRRLSFEVYRFAEAGSSPGRRS